MPLQLHHEKLIVYQDAIAFVSRACTLTDSVPSKRSVKEQLVRAAESVPLNVAVGNSGQGSASQFQSLELASSSAAECASCLDVLLHLKSISDAVCIDEKKSLISIFRHLIGLRRSREVGLKLGGRKCTARPQRLSPVSGHRCHGCSAICGHLGYRHRKRTDMALTRMARCGRLRPRCKRATLEVAPPWQGARIALRFQQLRPPHRSPARF